MHKVASDRKASTGMLFICSVSYKKRLVMKRTNSRERCSYSKRRAIKIIFGLV